MLSQSLEIYLLLQLIEKRHSLLLATKASKTIAHTAHRARPINLVNRPVLSRPPLIS
jgi:hypothetical protein